MIQDLQPNRPKFQARSNVDQLDGRVWSNLFESHKTLSDVWHAADHPDALVWMLSISGYRNDRVLRTFAMWMANQVIHLTPDGGWRATRELFMAVTAYTSGLGARENLDRAYENYENSFSANAKQRYASGEDSDDSYARGVSAALSAVYAVGFDDAWGAVSDVSCLARTALTQAATYQAEKAPGGDDGSVEVIRDRTRADFNRQCADKVRELVGDPFMFLDPDIEARHLALLRRAIKGRRADGLVLTDEGRPNWM